MSTIINFSVWQIGMIVLFAIAWGFAIGAAVFYHVGRVKGYTQAANEVIRDMSMRGLLYDGTVEKLARKSGATLRGDFDAKN